MPARSLLLLDHSSIQASWRPMPSVMKPVANLSDDLSRIIEVRAAERIAVIDHVAMIRKV